MESMEAIVGGSIPKQNVIGTAIKSKPIEAIGTGAVVGQHVAETAKKIKPIETIGIGTVVGQCIVVGAAPKKDSAIIITSGDVAGKGVAGTGLKSKPEGIGAGAVVGQRVVGA